MELGISAQQYINFTHTTRTVTYTFDVGTHMRITRARRNTNAGDNSTQLNSTQRNLFGYHVQNLWTAVALWTQQERDVPEGASLFSPWPESNNKDV